MYAPWIRDLQKSIASFLAEHQAWMPAFEWSTLKPLGTFLTWEVDEQCVMIYFTLSETDPSELHMDLIGLRILRKDCVRSGTSYMSSLRYFLDHFFTSPGITRMLRDCHEITRVRFQLEDVSSVVGLPSWNVTAAMVSDTNAYVEGPFDLEQSERVYRSVREQPELVEFYNALTHHPKLSPYLTPDLRPLARYALTLLEPGAPYITTVKQLLLLLWFKYMLPRMTMKRYDMDDSVLLSLHFPLSLGRLSVLGNEEGPMTWYMKVLSLQTEDDAFHPKAVRIRESRAWDAVSEEDKAFLTSLRGYTVKEAYQRIAQHCRDRRCTFYDMFVYTSLAKCAVPLYPALYSPYRVMELN